MTGAVASRASATCSRDTKQRTGSARAAGERPRDRVPTASSSSRRLSSWTGSPISSRRRGSTGIAITGCLPRITGSGGPSRRWRSGTSASGARPRRAGRRTTGTAPEGEEFPLQCPGCGGDIRLIAFITEPGPVTKRLPAGAGPRRTGGLQAGEGQDGFARVQRRRRPSRPPVAHPPTGANLCRPMTTATSFKSRLTSCP